MESIDLFNLPPRVFISYSHADRGFVERLAHDLARNRIIVWWDEWEIRVGDSLIQKIESGITSTSYLAIILSANSVASAWVQEELRAALNRQLSEKKTIVLPVLLNDCDVPLFLREKRYADFRKDYDFGLKNLLRAISSPDVGIRGGGELKEYFNDWAIDWLTKRDGSFGLKVEVMSHSPKLPYSVQATIIATTTDPLSKRFRDYIEAGFSWVIPGMLLVQIHDSITKKSPILLIAGDEVASDGFGIIDPKYGMGIDVLVEARRLGSDPSDDILYEWGSTFMDIMEKHVEKIKSVIPQEELTNWGRWLIANPL